MQLHRIHDFFNKHLYNEVVAEIGPNTAHTSVKLMKCACGRIEWLLDNHLRYELEMDHDVYTKDWERKYYRPEVLDAFRQSLKLYGHILYDRNGIAEDIFNENKS